MRIVVVHSFYSNDQPGGENLAVDAQVAALLRAGHDVRLVQRRTDDLKGRPLHAARVGAALLTRGGGDGPWAEVLAHRPDVVHIHNLFPNLSAVGLAELAARLPVVATMHNYRPFCSAATLSRAGKADCLDCINKSRWSGVRHGCYRGSRLASLPLAATRQFADDPVLRAAHQLVMLTPAMRDNYAAFGVPQQKMTILPNFLPSHLAGRPGPGGDRFIFVGRISAEKGLLDLVRQWPANQLLDVVGAGPDEDAARKVAPPSVRFLGALSRSEVVTKIGTSLGLIIPSRWREGMPLVYAEALAVGTPVLALQTNDVARLVQEDGSGLTSAWLGLDGVLSAATSSFPSLRGDVRNVFDRRYTERAHIGHLTRIYRSLATDQPACSD